MTTLRLGKATVDVFARTTTPGLRMHRRWWTALPAVPATREGRAYRRLKRQFADHTMNSWVDEGGLRRPGNRGFYIEGREDHLVAAFFENFAMYPDLAWFAAILRRLGIRHEPPIADVNWSYSFEERLAGLRIADVVFMWRDAAGDGVLVVEAKKPGFARTGIGEKDDLRQGYYLDYSAMRAIRRRHQALLVDEGDRRKLPPDLQGLPSILTWQQLVDIQHEALDRQRLPSPAATTFERFLSAHHRELGLTGGPAEPPLTTATAARYREIASSPLPESLKTWLMGAELYFGTRASGAAEVPHAWLLDELDAADYRRRKLQSTRERGLPIWQLA